MFVKFYDKVVKDENGRLESRYRILRPSENLRNACRQAIGYTEILRFQTAFFRRTFSDGLFAFRRIKQHENGGGEHHQDGGQHHRAVVVFRTGGAEILINQGGEREPFGA